MLRMLLAFILPASLMIACSDYPDKASASIEIEKAYDQISQAVADHDLEKLMSFIDEDAAFIDEHSNREDIDDYERHAEETFATTKNNRLRTTLKDMRITGDIAVIYYNSTFRFEIYNEAMKMWVPVIFTSSGNETWELRAGSWKIIQGETLHRESEVDPQFVAEYKELLGQYSRFMGKLPSYMIPCNFSYNGCL